VSELTDKQAQFVREYLIDLNASQAAVRAGYKGDPNTVGPRLLANVGIRSHVEAAMAKRGERTEVTADRVIREIARLAFFDPRKLLTSEGEPIPIQELDDDTAAAIAGLETATERVRGEDGGSTHIRKYKIADKNSALEKLAKHLGIYELDNHQKTDALTEILKRMAPSALPVSRD
jgi:phage terminase small subunit